MLNKLFQLAAMFAGLTGQTLPDPIASYKAKCINEINQVSDYLKCTWEELYCRWKDNKKLLTRDSGNYLKKVIEKKNKDENLH